MAAFALTDVDLYAGTSSTALDVSCFANQFELMATPGKTVDATTFCSGGWDVPLVGHMTTMISASGPTDMATATASTTSAVDEVMALDLGGAWTLGMVPAGGTVGNVAYFTTGTLTSRGVLQGAVGDLATHAATWRSTAKLVRGSLFRASAITATGSSASQQLGAVAATQRLYVAVILLTAGGTTPSITVKIQSDDNSGFTSATDRLTLSAQTTKSAQTSSVAGAITDDYWRAYWTVSGTSPSFDARILIGIA